MSKIKNLLLLFLLLLGLIGGYEKWNQQFRIGKLYHSFSNQFRTPQTLEQLTKLNQIISQPFLYLDRGKQSFAFVSQDDRYVIKFFDDRCIQDQHSLFSRVDQESCEKKMHHLAEGYYIGYNNDLNNTGILAMQLVPQHNKTLLVHLKDRFNISYKINLADFPYVVQEKAIPTRIVITNLLHHREINKASTYLKSLVTMYKEGYSKGVYDKDHNFMYNTGFVGERPIRIDLGRLRIDEKMKQREIYSKDLNKIINERLSAWLSRYFPEYKNQLLSDLQYDD